jgi:hypothetical protein
MVNRRLSTLLIILFIAIVTSSCASKTGDTFVSPSPSSPLLNGDAAIYNVPVKNLSESGFHVTEVSLPRFTGVETSEIIIHALVDETHVLATRSRGDNSAFWPPTDEFAYFDIVRETWEEPLNSDDKYIYFVYADDEYCIGTTTEEAMVYKSGTLVLMDRHNRSGKTIFEYEPKDGLTGEHPNNVVIWNGQVYFDDFNHESAEGSLYAYNIKSGELRVVRENAMNPIIYKDEVWFFTQDENGDYTLLSPESGGESLQNPHEIGGMASSGDRLFTTRSMGVDNILGTSLTGVFEWSANTAIAESRGGNVIFGNSVKASEGFLVWNTAMDGIPCLYDITADTLFEITDFRSCESEFFLDGNTALLYMRETDNSGAYTGNEKFLLIQKL